VSATVANRDCLEGRPRGHRECQACSKMVKVAHTRLPNIPRYFGLERSMTEEEELAVGLPRVWLAMRPSAWYSVAVIIVLSLASVTSSPIY